MTVSFGFMAFFFALVASVRQICCPQLGIVARFFQLTVTAKHLPKRLRVPWVIRHSTVEAFKHVRRFE